VGSRHFENPARRAWWSVHVDAWRRSGLSQRLYCRRHRLTETTFVRWRKQLIDDKVLCARAELQREKRLERRRRKGQPLSADGRSKAVQAFWAMHVEAMTWSGMGVRDYATAHHLSEHSLRRWRDLIAADEMPNEWRTLLHPSARPPISTGASTGAKERHSNEGLTRAHAADPTSDRRLYRRF
jgi:hypothetical protein